MDSLEKRMYFIVPYNISPIQQAIQAGHAALEYARKYSDDEDFIDFADNHKTWVILDGGTTNSTRDENDLPKGTLNQYMEQIWDNNIKHAVFYEPDLNNALTAICLIVDERVYNTKDYPDFGQKWAEKYMFTDKKELWFVMENEERNEKLWEIYKKEVGEDIAFLKKLLNDKKLA